MYAEQKAKEVIRDWQSSVNVPMTVVAFDMLEKRIAEAISEGNSPIRFKTIDDHPHYPALRGLLLDLGYSPRECKAHMDTRLIKLLEIAATGKREP